MKFSKFKIALFSFLAFLIFPITSFGATFLSQPDFSSVSTYSSNISISQSLGSSISNTLDSITVDVKSLQGNKSFSLRIYCYTDSAYTVSCNSGNPVSMSDGFSVTGTLAFYTVPMYLFTTSVQHNSKYTFLSNRYYVLTISADSGTGVSSAGSLADTYFSGFCPSDLSRGCYPLSDIYFLLNDTNPPPSDLSGNTLTVISPTSGSTTASLNVYVAVDFYNTGYAYPNYNQVCADFTNLQASPTQTPFFKHICWDLNQVGTLHLSTTTLLAHGQTGGVFYQYDPGTNSHALTKSVYFTVVGQNINLNGTTTPQFDATTTPLVDCSSYGWVTDSTKRLGCEITNGFTQTIQFLFYPSTGVLDNFSNLKSQYEHKPPFGYISAISTVISSATTTATTTTQTIFYYGSIPGISLIFGALRTGLIVILWIMFGIYIYKRFSNFQP